MFFTFTYIFLIFTLLIFQKHPENETINNKLLYCHQSKRNLKIKVSEKNPFPESQ